MLDLDFPAPPVEASFLMKSPFNETLDPRIELTREVAYTILAPIIVTIGIVGNLLTILILRLPQFRGVTYTYFLVLAISDLISLIFCISMLIHLSHVGTHLYSTAVWYSYLELPLINAPMSTSIFIIVCITVDRFFSVCRPSDFKKIHTNKYALAGIIGAVITAVAVWVPAGFLKEPKYYSKCNSTAFVPPYEGTWWVSCMKIDTRKSTWYIAYSWTRQTITIFIPAIVLIILNSLIVREFLKLRKKRKELLGHDQPDQSKESPTKEKKRQENQHLIHLLAAAMISFSITIIPSGIFGALYNEELSDKFHYELFRALANDLEILNHALNFYLYILYSKPIREVITKIFRNQHKKLENMAVSNILVVIQKTASSIGRVNSPTSDSDAHKETSLRETGNQIRKSQREKSKTVSQETQRTYLTSESESSFNGIVAADIIPKDDKIVNKIPEDREESDAMDLKEYLQHSAQNSQGENVYLKAVEKRKNKPPNGLQTIVHQVEIHNCQSADNQDTYLNTDETVDIINETSQVKENADVVNESNKNVAVPEIKVNGFVNIDKETTTILDVAVESGGLVNLGYVHDEGLELHKKEHQPNGDIHSPSSVKVCNIH